MQSMVFFGSFSGIKVNIKGTVATEARYQLRMVPFTYLTCMKK